MRRIVDLTLTLAPGMRGVEIRPLKSLGRDTWNSSTLQLYSHCGTHMDAPRHFLADGRTIDAVPLEACIGPARVLDLTPVAPREVLAPERLAAWREVIRPGDRVLLRTDWSRRLGTKAYRDQLPRIGIELARWLVERRVVLVGVEPPSVADVNNPDEVTEVHRTLLGGGIVIVEGLANLHQLSSELVHLVVLPLKVHQGDGSPVRAIAIERDDEG